jgi:hypothetical protein
MGKLVVGSTEKRKGAKNRENKTEWMDGRTDELFFVLSTLTSAFLMNSINIDLVAMYEVIMHVNKYITLQSVLREDIRNENVYSTYFSGRCFRVEVHKSRPLAPRIEKTNGIRMHGVKFSPPSC